MSNITGDMCKICDGRTECAPTSILLITLIHLLYGQLGSVPNYFKQYREEDAKSEENDKEDEKYDDHLSEYDFIIIGGGTAGCVLASRLSENPKWNVLLLEAGMEQPKMTLIPGFTSEFHESVLDWQYRTRPSEGFCQNNLDKGCAIIQGRVLGGTSSINDMAYIRGNSADYDEWELEGIDGWSYSKVLPYFKFSEGNYDSDVLNKKFFHSAQGPLDVGRYRYVDENVDILLSALSEMGYNYIDVNAKSQLGFTRIQTMSYLGERVSTYTAFIEPIRKERVNLNIKTEALVTKILFISDKRRDSLMASAVEYIKNGEIHTIKATKEVILSAGAINSPKLLMQSGIGPKEYLEYVYIKPYLDLPVGLNFHDHVDMCLPVVKLSKSNTIVKFTEKLKDITKYYAKGEGPLSANFQVMAFLETSQSDETGTPDIAVRFRGHGSNMYYDTMEVCVTLLTPKSRGLVILNASHPVFGEPLIYPNYLNDPTDINKILEGLQLATKIFDTNVFKRMSIKFDGEPLLQNACRNYETVSEEFWLCVIKQFSMPMHNYVGTCKMGTSKDPKAVVNSKFKVYGLTNLRIVDASVIPKVTRGFIAAPVIMMAERASRIIKEFWLQ